MLQPETIAFGFLWKDGMSMIASKLIDVMMLSIYNTKNSILSFLKIEPFGDWKNLHDNLLYQNVFFFIYNVHIFYFSTA
jgi:hypothetical protein